MSLTPDQLKLSPEELAKDVQMKVALAILKQLDPSVDIQWVKKGSKEALLPGNRKIMQPEG